MDPLSPDKRGIKKGQILNPQGRPKGSPAKTTQIKNRLLGKWSIHPVDRLVKLANELEIKGQYEEAAAIWENLLKYFEPTKKPVECAPEKTTPEESVAAAEETFRLLEELENHGLSQTESSKGTSVEEGKIDVPSETSPKEDLPGHTEQ